MRKDHHLQGCKPHRAAHLSPVPCRDSGTNILVATSEGCGTRTAPVGLLDKELPSTQIPVLWALEGAPRLDPRGDTFF